MAEALHRCCPACGSDNREAPPLECSQADWRLKGCTRCKLVYLENAMPYEAMEERFAWSKTCPEEARQRGLRQPLIYSFRAAYARARNRWLPHHKAHHLFRKFLGQGKILDIGCGPGVWLRQLDPAFTPYGIEIDKGAAEVANAFATQRGGEVYQADALSGLQTLEPAQFDGVLMCSYLEHEIQPLDVLKATKRVLKAEGVLVIKVPNFDCWNRRLQGNGWPGFRFPDHVNYFTASTLRQMIDDADLSVARFHAIDQLPTSDNLWLVARRAA